MKIYRQRHTVFAALALAAFCFMASVADAQAQKKEHISATARGTSTQLGRQISVDIRIFEFSTAEDQKALFEAFQSNGTQGLANALEKMSAKGRASITGTLGYDLNYIREFKMPDGSRKIRFVTDRAIHFGEVWGGTRSMDYMLSMGEIILSKDKGKSSGVVMPAAKMKLNKEGELEIETFQNPWELVNVRLW
jgi:hypothetical protein